MADDSRVAPSRVSRLASLPPGTWLQELQGEFEQWGNHHPLATEFDRLKTKKGKYFLREDSVELLAYLKNEFSASSADTDKAIAALKVELSKRIDAIAADYSSKLASEIQACREQLTETMKKDAARLAKELRDEIREADSKAKEDAKNLDREVEELRETVESVSKSFETFRKQSLNPLMETNRTLQGEVKEEMADIRIGMTGLREMVGTTCNTLEGTVKTDMETMRKDQQKRDREQDAQAKHVEMQLRETLETIQRDISAAQTAFSNVSEQTVHTAESALDRLRQAKHAKILRLEDDLKMLRSFTAGICTRRVEWRTGDLSEVFDVCPISPRGGGRPQSSSGDQSGSGLEFRRVNSEGSDQRPATVGSPSSQARANNVIGAFMTAGSNGSSPVNRNKSVARGSAFDSSTTMRPSLTAPAGTVSARLASPLMAVLSGADLAAGSSEGSYESLGPDPDDAGAVRVSSPQFDAAGLQSLRLQLKIKLRRAKTSNNAPDPSNASSSSAASNANFVVASSSSAAGAAGAAGGGAVAGAGGGGALPEGRPAPPAIMSETEQTPLEAFCTLFLMGPPGLRVAFKLRLGGTTVQRSHFFDASGLCPLGCEAIFDEAALKTGNLNISVELLEVIQNVWSFGQPDRTSVKEVDPYAPYPLVLCQHNNFRTLDVVQEQLDYMKSLMSRHVEWNLKNALSLPRAFPQGEAICSKTFSAAGVEGLQLLFYPSGYTGAKEGYCSFYLHCPPGTTLRCWLGVGRHRRDARVAFETASGLFGRTNFCRYNEAVDASTDTLLLTLELDDTNMSLSEMAVDSGGAVVPESPTQRPQTGTPRGITGNPPLATPPGSAPAAMATPTGLPQHQYQQQFQQQQQQQYQQLPPYYPGSGSNSNNNNSSNSGGYNNSNSAGLTALPAPPGAAVGGPTGVINSTFTRHRGGGKAVLKEVQQLPSLWTSAVPCNVGELLDGFHTFREPRFKKPVGKGAAAAARRIEHVYGAPLPGSAKAQSPSLADRYHMYS